MIGLQEPRSDRDHLIGCSEAITPPKYYTDTEGNYYPSYGLESLGMRNLGRVYRNLSVPQLVEHAIARKEGVLAANGALVVETGKYTGRSPKDKFIVKEPSTQAEIDWNNHNVPISEEKFERIYRKVLSYVQGRDLYIFDGYVGSDPQYRFGVRVINELAFQNLFAHQLFLRPSSVELVSHKADFTVIAVPGLHGDPEDDGINSEAFILLNLAKKLVLIGGTRYAGEIKKSVFSMMNYLMTKQNVLPMHGAANIDKKNHTALFFGLSGTGKTTLSADPKRSLIGDDEHGWSDEGIFNFEGGCYAKVIRLSPVAEPEIYKTTRCFGTVLENVAIEPGDRRLDLDDDSLTENTRAAYPLSHIPNASRTGMGNHPKNVIFLTADAFGVMPPIARLTKEQAMYHFLSGYTAKVAGTERGMGSEPQATFSACFGAPFMALHPSVYAELLGHRIEAHNVKVWLVNTGWTSGPYGVGHRMSIKHTRALLTAALTGALDNVPMVEDPVFGFQVPETCPGVPKDVLKPRLTWHDPAAYDAQARKLAQMFIENFKQFTDVVDAKVMNGAPRIAQLVS